MVPADLGGGSGPEVAPIDPPNPTESTHENDEAEPIDDDGEIVNPHEEPEVTPEEIPASQPALLEFPWDDEEDEEELSEYDKYTPEDKALPLEPPPNPKSSKGWKDIPPSPMERSDDLQLKLAKKALAKLKKQQHELILSCVRIAVFFSHFAGLHSISVGGHFKT